MGQQMRELKCPDCGASVSVGQIECDYCHNPITISTFHSVYDMPMPWVNAFAKKYQAALNTDPDNMPFNKSVAFCYLKLKLYDKAQEAFEKAIEDNFDDADIYLYTAVCLLKGKRPFLAQRKTIDQGLEYLNAALSIEPKGIFHYLSAYLKYDFYEMKRLRIVPGYREELQLAVQLGLSELDKTELFSVMGVQRPGEF